MTTDAVQQEVDIEQAASAIRALIGGGNDMDDVLGEAQRTGFAQSKSATMVDIYNRWDGRHQQIAAYQAPKILSERFPEDRQLYPEQVWNQLAWVLRDPSKAGELKRMYGPREWAAALPCYFSEAQDDSQVLADVEAAGIPQFCRKGGPDGPIRFRDELARQAHHKKHPRAMEALKTYRDRRDSERRVEAEQSQVATLSLLVEQLLAERAQTTAKPAETAPSASGGNPDPYVSDFTCDECSLSYPSKASLSAHKRIHNRE